MNIQVTFKNKLFVISVVLSICWLGLSRAALISAAPQAVQIAVLSPSGSATDVVGEGDDYFTQVVGQPRSMDHPDDLMFQSSGVTNIAMANGIWSATATPWGTNPLVSISEVWPVYPGFTQANGAQLGNYGWNHPINTRQYQQLSFRIRVPVTSSSPSLIHLGYSAISQTQETGRYYTSYRKSGWDVFNLNLSSVMPGWSSSPQVYGLAYLFGIPGNFKFDWMRLTNPATSPVVAITYVVTGTNSGDTVDLNCYMTAIINDENYCGPIATGLPINSNGTHSYSWRTAYLAPGSYYVQAIVKHGNTAFSDLSQGPLTIKPAPIIHFDAPSMTSGPDYATVEMGNPWDMNDSSDIKLLQSWMVHDLQAPCPCFSNGELYATTTDYTNPKQPNSDPYVYLHVDRTRPVDASKYKYLTYRYKIDGPKWSNSVDRLESDYLGQNPPYYPAAWLVRLIFFTTYDADLDFMNQTNDIIVFDDWNTYQMDLSKGLQQGYWENDPGQQGGSAYWTGLKYWIRFDFLEGYQPWTVHLDDVKLTGNDQATTGFNVRWTLLESGVPTQVDFYANTNPAQCGYSGSPISRWPVGGQTVPPLSKAHTVYLPTILSNYSVRNYRQLWDTSQVAAGSYFVCAIARDGYNTSRWVSETPVDVQH
jgi:hypothetical protein